MKNAKIKLIAFVALLGSCFQATAQEQKSKFSIEIDPITYVFKGYSVHLRWQPKNCDHLLLGLGTYAMDLPDAMVNFDSKNKEEGWKVRINQAYGLFAEHHFTEVNHKWFVGGQLGIQEYKIENETIAGSEKYNNILAMGYFGYTFKPFKNNLYFKPWAGLGYTSKISGDNTIGASEYHIAPIMMFATLHVGYTF
jgi:hypothetical protein